MIHKNFIHKLKVAGSTLNQTPLDWVGNFERIKSILKKAEQAHLDIICLPELSISGYGCEDAFFNLFVIEESWRMLKKLLPFTNKKFVGFGIPILHRSCLYNCVAVVVDQKIIGLVAKKALAGDGVHYEQRWFKPWPHNVVDKFEYENISIPIGDIYFEVDHVKIGFEICEEAWGTHRPGSDLARRGVEIILNPSASHFAFGKHQIRKNFVSEGSRAFNVIYIYSNLVGNESGRIIYDGGTLIAQNGEFIAEGPRFSFADYNLTISEVELGRATLPRMKTISYQPQLEFQTKNLVKVNFKWSKIKTAKINQIPTHELTRFEEFSKAVSLGLFDFLRKSGLHGFVISLSGGIDSSVCAILAEKSFEWAKQELSPEEFQRKILPIINNQNIKNGKSKFDIKNHVFCVYQSTKNSSETTYNAAEKLAKELGVTFYHWSVDELVDSYIKIVEEPLLVKLNWKDHDVILQNIQARARGPSVWMLANLKNSLLITTSNRSEAAVGYATMDGDTCGGLAPLGGIDKEFLISWCHQMSDRIKSLKLVLEQPPTAELRPQFSSQTDEQDLMPYSVLNIIEKYAIRDKRSPIEIYYLLEDKYSHEDLKKWISKFFKLWARNQWKRERYAPSFHLDDESLDPKTWCRFPILSSGFQTELEELYKIPIKLKSSLSKINRKSHKKYVKVKE